MPLDLTTPIEVTSAKTASVSRIKILSILIQDDKKFLLVKIAREDAGILKEIPGTFRIEDVPEAAGREYDVGDKVFSVAQGNYLSDIAGDAPSGAGNRAVIKNACYKVLDTMYGLAGIVS